MTVRVSTPDGVTVDFPAGTDEATISRVMRGMSGPSVGDGSKASQGAAPAPGMLAAGLEGAGQGLTFGFGDEIEGGARAAVAKLRGDARPFGEVYDENVKIPRSRIEAAQSGNYGSYLAGNLGGSLVVPGGLARAGIRGAVSASAGRGIGARTVAGVKEGAAYGALYGAGQAEGGVGDRLTGAAQGGAAGAVIGGAMPGTIDVVANVGRRAVAPFRGVTNPEGFAAEKFGEAAARDLSRDRGVADPAAVAQRFSERFDDMSAANPAVRAMDVGGENLRGLMRSAANMPNQAREGARKALDARQSGQHARITDDLHSGMGEGRNFYEAIDKQVSTMERIGQNVIGASLKMETPMTPQLQRVFERPTMQDLQKLITRKLADEDKPIGLLTRTEMIHRMKMELDDQIGMAVRAEKMGNKPQAGWDKGTLVILKRDLLNSVDNVTYKKGLKSYAGEARLKNAAEDGMDNFTRSAPEEIKATLAAFETEAERQMYRMGASRAIVDAVRKGNANRDRTESIFGSPEMQLKLHEIFPTRGQARAFQKQLVIEAKMADSRKAMQGNSTTAKQLTEGQEAGKTSRMVMSAANAATGRLEPALALVAQGMNAMSGITPGVANRIIEMGMSKDPRHINRLAAAGIERAATAPQKRAAVARALVSGGAAMTAPDPASDREEQRRRLALALISAR